MLGRIGGALAEFNFGYTPISASFPKANVGTFKPYDPSVVVGDTTPTLPNPPPPDKGCGGLGMLIMVVVAVVATIATAGALAGASGSAVFSTGASVLGGTAAGTAGTLGTLGMAGTAAVAGAVGSIASQVAGNMLGVVDGFSWKSVALSAISAGATAGVSQALGAAGQAAGQTTASWQQVAARAAMGNAITQGVGVITGLQDKFDWKGVAASAVGAGVGQGLNAAMGYNPAVKFDFSKSFASSLGAGTAAAVMRGGKVAVQQVAIDAFGNALGNAFVDMAQNAGTQENKLYSLEGSTGSGVGLHLGGGSGLSYGGLRASDSSVLDNLSSNDSPIDLPSFDMFEGTLVAGPGGSPERLVKVGASATWKGHQEAIYGALDDLNAAVSMGNQDPTRLAELRNGALDALNYRRIAMQTDPAVMQEILNRGLTSKNDLDKLGMLGAFGDSDTVHRIAVATAQAGGAGRASAQGIASQLAQLNDFGPSFVNRIPGDMAVEAAAPGVYLNTLLGMRNHVDTTMLYMASMSGDQMAQLGRYTDTVMAQGGMTRYQDNEKLAGLFSSMQTTGAGMARMGEGLSVVGMGLRNFGASLGQSIGNMNPEILLNSTIGRMLSQAIGPMYIVPKGYSVAYEMKLNPQDFGKSPKIHNRLAAESLRGSVAQDPELAAMMNSLGVKVDSKPTPSGWTWEHASTSTAAGQSGVMRLVPRDQHTPGSDWWRVIHPDPGAAGGYAEWARPAGAPKR